MKIAYASDIHLEFGDIQLKNTDNADVLILAGDIMISTDLIEKEKVEFWKNALWASRSEKFHKFFINCCEEFKNVIYIFGNHEYYHGDFATELDKTRGRLSYLPNLHILDKQSIEIGGVTFLCGTMWTNFNNNDPIVKWDINKGMNDFHITKNSTRMLSEHKPGNFMTDDAYEDHLAFMEFLGNSLTSLEEDKKVVVVTHHNPSIICSLPEYRSDPLTFAYYSNLDEFIISNPKINAWVCGHSHNRIDEMIGSTRILMNCRGYPGHEKEAETFELKSFEV